MTITIASGKGGTGKTTIAVNLAAALAAQMPVKLLDADVEAPNCHLFLNPELNGSRPVYLEVPDVNQDFCTLCGICAKVCEFHAIGVFGDQVLVFPELCHACGGCSLVCPEGAVEEKKHQTGLVRSGRAGGVFFAGGLLTIGEAKAPPVIRAVKQHKTADGLNIIDAPPGTSCAVVEALSDSDFAVLVTEPTPFGLNDLELAVNVVREMAIPFGVVVNRAGIGDDRVNDFCRQQNIDILLEVPENRRFAEAYSRGQMLTDAFPDFGKEMQTLYRRIAEAGGVS